MTSSSLGSKLLELKPNQSEYPTVAHKIKSQFLLEVGGEKKEKLSSLMSKQVINSSLLFDLKDFF